MNAVTVSVDVLPAAGPPPSGPGAADLVARTLLALLACLLAFSLAPRLVGWTSVTIISGSMAPRLMVGDVLVVSPVRPAQLAVGQVLLVDDPVRPQQLLSHRLVRFTDDGALVLRGDANPGDDSTPVPLSAVHGIGRLRVPVVGLPMVWLAQGRYVPLSATAAALLLACAVVVLGRRAGPRD